MEGQAVRAKVREVLQAGKLPSRSPDSAWGGSGVGAACAVCDLPITHDQLEFEIQFTHDGDNQGSTSTTSTSDASRPGSSSGGASNLRGIDERAGVLDPGSSGLALAHRRLRWEDGRRVLHRVHDDGRSAGGGARTFSPSRRKRSPHRASPLVTALMHLRCDNHLSDSAIRPDDPHARPRALPPPRLDLRGEGRRLADPRRTRTAAASGS
jgi:hypothetical protein